VSWRDRLAVALAGGTRIKAACPLCDTLMTDTLRTFDHHMRSCRGPNKPGYSDLWVESSDTRDYVRVRALEYALGQIVDC
jgi:hypothetical protein